jgi:hypothetical protein
VEKTAVSSDTDEIAVTDLAGDDRAGNCHGDDEGGSVGERRLRGEHLRVAGPLQVGGKEGSCGKVALDACTPAVHQRCRQ